MISALSVKLRSALATAPTAQVLAGFNAQPMSTASTEAKPQRISKNLSFRPAYDSPIAEKDRPLVLIYGWLVAKAKHIHKYGDFYLKKGFDVLHIKVAPTQLMRPVQAQKVVGQVIDFTHENHRPSQPMLIHGFSVGAYLFGETLVQMMSNPDASRDFQRRIQGQVLDSPVDVEGIPRGVSRAVTDVRALQLAMQRSIELYLNVLKNQTMKHYRLSSNTFRENSYKTPTLFLYSKKDVIGPAEAIEQIIQNWQARDIPAFGTRFEDSAHVSHFQQYPVEYITALTYFLQRIGLLTDEALKEQITVGS